MNNPLLDTRFVTRSKPYFGLLPFRITLDSGKMEKKKKNQRKRRNRRKEGVYYCLPSSSYDIALGYSL